MKVQRVQLENFSSYQRLVFDFNDSGVNVIYGPTGAGKSTLCDTVPWVLFGKTAKNGNVDDIVNWSSAAPASGTATVTVAAGTAHITRIRGPKANDLYFTMEGQKPLIRGKDLNDTQKLINELLGMDADAYLSAGYFHEFSATSQFFSTTPKNRRYLTEQIVDLAMVTTLADNCTAYKKDLKEEATSKKEALTEKRLRLEYATTALQEASTRSKDWEAKKAKDLQKLETGYSNFETIKQQAVFQAISDFNEAEIRLQQDVDGILEELKPDAYFEDKLKALSAEKHKAAPATCETCGAISNHKEAQAVDRQLNVLKADKDTNDRIKVTYDLALSRLERHRLPSSPYNKRIEQERSSTNHYAAQIERLKNDTENPYVSDITRQKALKVELSATIDLLQKELSDCNLELANLSTLSEILLRFREYQSLTTIKQLQDSTNSLLSAHFDSPLRVKFEPDSADKLDVSVLMDGTPCVYTQLSKGQRCLLKLCFGVSVMKQVANHKGIALNVLFFDEALDGCDAEIKIKALKLFETLALSYSAIYLVEHSTEIRAMINNQVCVTLTEHGSQIEKS